MGAVVLDASVLIGLLDPADAHHREAVDRADARRRAGSDLVVPASAFSEALVAPSRDGYADAAERAIGVLVSDIRALTASMARAAASLRARHPGLRLPDALVLATAMVEDADVLTADRRWARYSDRVEVIG